MSVLTFFTNADAHRLQKKLIIPEVVATAKRSITIDDVMALRQVDTLSLSPDGSRFAIFVRQADPVANNYRTAWYVGSVKGDALTYVGDGGEVQPTVRSTGHVVGEIAGRESRWSRDGQWIAYKLQRDSEVQLWRSRADGSMQEQITHNAADVREFAWSEDGRALYFTAGTPRAEQRARERVGAQQGYQYDEDLYAFTDLMLPKLRRPLETDLSVWVVTLNDRRERPAGELERAGFERAQARHAGGVETSEGFIRDAAVPPVARSDGALVWLVRSSPMSRNLQVVVSPSQQGSDPIACEAEECSGAIKSVWWSKDGKRVLFWRGEGINNTANGFYAWWPSTGAVSTIVRVSDDDFRHCSLAADDRLICVRETKTRPSHLAVIDLRSGVVQVIADVNPEFRNIRPGVVERVEWDTPKFDWNEPGGQLSGLYPKRAYGYILYPPDFDTSKTYPIFIDPYVAHGFSSSAGAEHALHVYAANGFVVLNLAFPVPTDASARLGANLMKQLYSEDLDLPHLTMLTESTVRGLDLVAARGFIDEHRVGIGGVSHGTFVPLFMMQKYDRIAAISISSPPWGPHEYYWATRKGRESIAAASGRAGYLDWRVKPEGGGREFWRRFDIADHIGSIEAPILMNLADQETYGVLRLIRHLADENKAYDAYVFRDETHFKWQPAHLRAIMNRNLDWFRFWLQGYEDSDPVKAEQYSRWRTLRTQRQANVTRGGRSGE